MIELSTMSVKRFIDEKEKASREIFEQTESDNVELDVDKLNFFGIPWWNCPNTGNRCSKECISFIGARMHENKMEIVGFTCSSFANGVYD